MQNLLLITTDQQRWDALSLWGKGITAYDDCQRIRALASWPAGQRKAVGHSPAMFSLVDVLPTLLGAAGLECPPHVQGTSQLPVITGQQEVVRDWALVDFLASPLLHQQTLVHGGYKLVAYRHADYGELYDLRADPDQYVNLWDRPQAAPVRRRMMHRLVQVNMEKADRMPRRI